MSYNSQTQQLNAYRETRIRTASQGQLIVMLYDEAIKKLDLAISYFHNEEKLDKIHNTIIKAQDIITELMVSLDFDRGGEIASNLFNLYRFFNEQLMDANIKKSPEPLSHVKSFMAELRDTWAQVVKKSNQDHADNQSGGIDISG